MDEDLRDVLDGVLLVVEVDWREVVLVVVMSEVVDADEVRVLVANPVDRPNVLEDVVDWSGDVTKDEELELDSSRVVVDPRAEVPVVLFRLEDDVVVNVNVVELNLEEEILDAGVVGVEEAAAGVP